MAQRGSADPDDDAGGDPADRNSRAVAGGGGPGLAGALTRLRNSFVALAGVTAALLGLLLHLRYGYQAGDGTHLTLSVPGLQLAHPEWFAGDWAIAHAQRPAWTFDLLTWLGAATGSLGGLYLLYWLGALAVFGAATALLARAWAPQVAWLTAALVTTVAALMPGVVFSTQSPLLAVATPMVLAGMLLYLSVAAALLRRQRLLIGAVVATVLADPSIGILAVFLLVALVVHNYRRSRRVNRLLAAGTIAGLAGIVIGLVVGSAALHVGDLATECDTIARLGCDATVWPRGQIRAGFSVVAVALLTVLFLPRSRRWPWTLLLGGLAAVLLGAVGLDLLNLPLGNLPRGFGAYLLAVLFIPLFPWGAVAPLVADVSARARWLGLTTVLVVTLVGIIKGGWALVDTNAEDVVGSPWLAILAALLVLACVTRTVPDVFGRPIAVLRGAFAATIVVLLISGALGGLALRGFNPGFRLADQDLAAWGAQVQKVVPTGAVLLAPPQVDQMAMATRRAVVVQCLNGPHDGQSWQEFSERMDAIGGVDQCTIAGRGSAYGSLSPTDLAAAADRFGATYIVVEEDQSQRRKALVDAGWKVVVEPMGAANFAVLSVP